MNVLVDMTHITPDKLYASLSIYVFRILDAMPAAERKHFTLLIPSELEDFTRRRYPEYAYLLFRQPGPTCPATSCSESPNRYGCTDAS